MTRGGQSGSGGFPLRPDFFRSLPLSKYKNDKLYGLAKQNARTCLNLAFNDQWRYVPPEKDGTQIRKDTSDLSASFRLVRAASVLRCQEHEVSQVLANTNSDSWREFCRKCCGKYFIDTLILHTVQEPRGSFSLGSQSVSDTSSTNTSMVRAAFDRAGINTSNMAPQSSRSALEDTASMDATRASLWNKGIGPHHAHLIEEDSLSASGCSTPAKLERHSSDASSVDLTFRMNNPPNMETISGSYSNQDADTNDGVSTNGGDSCGMGEDADELLTVKWGAFETGMSGRHDICLVDYLSLAYVPNVEPRERIHVWCFTSADGPRVGCNDLKDTHSISRTTLTKFGVFWRRTSDDETEVTVCGSFPSKHANMASAILLSCLGRLQSIVEDLRMSSQVYLQRSTWVNDRERMSCNLCMRNFYTLRRKHHCRKCGEVICSDCSTVETIDLPVIGYSKLRLCKVCSIRSRTTPLKKLDKCNIFDHLVRARSISNLARTDNSSCARSSYSEAKRSDMYETRSISDGTSQELTHTRPTNGYSTQSSSGYTHSAAVSAGVNNNDEDTYDFTNSGTSSISPGVTAVVHPLPESVSTNTSEPDDFIDAHCLKHQLKAMEEQKNGPNKGNMFDLLCELACQTLGCPIASVSIVDDKGDFIRSATGIDGNAALDRELSIFLDKVMGSTPAIVLDANVDKQVYSLFAPHGSPAIRFFAGCPIYSRAGRKLGYVCVADFTKRDTLGASCAFTMERLATLAVTTMERNVSLKRGDNRGSNQASEADDDSTVLLSHLVDDLADKSVVPVGRVVGSKLAPVRDVEVTSVGATSQDQGLYETQERMRKLLLKSYQTQQQLAASGSPTVQSIPHY